MAQKLVRARIPTTYGAFYSARDGAPDREWKGGEIAEVTEREATLYGLEIIQEDRAATSGRTRAP